MPVIEIVIDTSAILAVLLNEPERPGLISATRGAILCVPASVPWETGNALASLIRRRRLTAVEARRAVRSFERIPLRHVTINLGRAVQLAAELRVYAYDAYLIEASRVRGCGLLTLDQELMRAAQAVGVSLVEVER